MGSDDARRLILARRARFLASALASLSVAVACGGGTESEANPQPCLRKVPDGGMSADAEPQVCLGPTQQDAGKDGEPQVCLSPKPPDAGDAGDGGDGGDGG